MGETPRREVELTMRLKIKAHSLRDCARWVVRVQLMRSMQRYRRVWRKRPPTKDHRGLYWAIPSRLTRSCRAAE
jgi:hypothetical protein